MFDRIRGVLRGLTRRPARRRGLLVCPRCGSSKVKQADSISGFITPSRYFCPDCGYSGYFIVEIDKKEDRSEESGVRGKEKGKEGEE